MFPKSCKINFSLPYNNQISTHIIAPYNTTLSLAQDVNLSDLTVTADNKSLYYLASKKLEVDFGGQLTYNHNNHVKTINKLIAQVQSSMTLSARFNDNILLCSLKDIITNLIQYPQVHYAIPSFLPLIA